MDALEVGVGSAIVVGVCAFTFFMLKKDSNLNQMQVDKIRNLLGEIAQIKQEQTSSSLAFNNQIAEIKKDMLLLNKSHQVLLERYEEVKRKAEGADALAHSIKVGEARRAVLPNESKILLEVISYTGGKYKVPHFAPVSASGVEIAEVKKKLKTLER